MFFQEVSFLRRVTLILCLMNLCFRVDRKNAFSFHFIVKSQTEMSFPCCLWQSTFRYHEQQGNSQICTTWMWKTLTKQSFQFFLLESCTATAAATSEKSCATLSECSCIICACHVPSEVLSDDVNAPNVVYLRFSSCLCMSPALFISTS